MKFNICTLNVRGLGSKQKRNQVFQWLKNRNVSICLLQETHITNHQESNIKVEWGDHFFLSGSSNNSQGIGIFINPNLVFKFISHTNIVNGRLQALHLQIDEKDIIIINIYGSNLDDITLLESLEAYIIEHDDFNFIIGGDFNTILDNKLDKKNGKKDTHFKCRTKLKSIIESHNFSDIWRLQHPGKCQYTWHSNNSPPIFCRLDYFLISENLNNFITSSCIKTGFKTDHSIVDINIDLIRNPKGHGYFKLNNNVLLHPDYQEKIRKTIKDIAEININTKPQTLWKIIK